MFIGLYSQLNIYPNCYYLIILPIEPPQKGHFLASPQTFFTAHLTNSKGGNVAKLVKTELDQINFVEIACCLLIMIIQYMASNH